MRRSMATLCLVAILGCNEFHEPFTIDPKTEMSKSHQSVSAGRTTIHVPDGWTAASVFRDEKGHAVNIILRRFDGDRSAGLMHFIAQEQPPHWLEHEESKSISTDRHKNVPYWVEPSRAPSGDDTPGSYGVCAFIVTADTQWEINVGFFRPVRPDIETALQYIDALEFDETRPVPAR